MFGGRVGIPELLLILAVLLVIFGPRKLPELGKSLGASIRSFKKSVSEEEPPKSVDQPGSSSDS